MNMRKIKISQNKGRLPDMIKNNKRSPYTTLETGWFLKTK
jgi:hypothetical protein